MTSIDDPRAEHCWKREGGFFVMISPWWRLNVLVLYIVVTSPHQEGFRDRYVFGRVGLFDFRPSDYLISNERIWMRLLPEAYLDIRNNRLSSAEFVVCLP